MKLVHVVIFPLATALACCGGTVIKSSEDSGGFGHVDSGSSGSDGGSGDGTVYGDADAGGRPGADEGSDSPYDTESSHQGGFDECDGPCPSK
jgi:hypothetical protein